MNWERLADLLVEELLHSGLFGARGTGSRRNGRPRPNPARQAPPAPPNSDQAVLDYIWRTAAGLPERFGGSFPKFQQAYAQGWVRWHIDQGGLHVFVGPPGETDAPPSEAAEEPPPIDRRAIARAILVLGLKPDPIPPADLIRVAYIDLVKRYHPDRNPRGGARMKKITEAYTVLKGAKLAP